MRTRDEWVTVADFPNYEVNRKGQVRRKAMLMKPGAIPTGHLTVALSTGNGKPKSVYVHRLVLSAFTDNPENKPLVNHKNGNPKDNRIENLEWATYSENIKHGYEKNGRRTPSECKVAAFSKDGEWIMSFRSYADAGRLLGVNKAAIRSAVLRKGTSCGYYWRNI